MSAQADSGTALETAFAAFSTHSERLESVFLSLQREVVGLNRELAAARSERMEQLLEKERLGNRLAMLLEALPGAVVVLDGEGIVVECNSHAVELLGRPLIGLTWSEIIRREFDAGRGAGGELRLADGRWLSLSRRQLGAEPGEILLLTDVTETRRLQELVERQGRLSAMGEMTARLAHQIRTPLASALLYVSQVAAGMQDAASARRFAARASAKLRDLEQMVNDMVVFAGGGRGSEESFPVAAMLADVVDWAVPLSGDAGRVLAGPADPDLRLCGNRPALTGALANLVQNALQNAGPAANVTLAASAGDDGEILISVADDGPGVDPSLRDRIFQPFFTTRRQGTGLGLAVVASVARAHGGSVSVADSGPGATFVLVLPAEHGEAMLASRTGFASREEATDGRPRLQRGGEALA